MLTFAVVVFAASGVSLIGDSLAAIKPVTKLVELFDLIKNPSKMDEYLMVTCAGNRPRSAAPKLLLWQQVAK